VVELVLVKVIVTKTKADYEKELEELDFSSNREDIKNIWHILDLQAQGAMSGEQVKLLVHQQE
jgi:hypothetical protein